MTSMSRGRARIGIFVPFTNTNLEPDMALLRPEGVSLHFARLGGYDANKIPDEDQMAELGASDMEEPLRLLLGVKPDIVMYGCTSATLSHGPEFDRDLAMRINCASGAETVTAAGAVLHALQVLGTSRVGFASPYVPSLNNRAIGFLAEEGIATVSRADVDGPLDNAGQGAVAPDDVFNLGKRADSPEAQAIVLSCTDMRAVECIARLEDAIGKPVVTSNQALMFAALQRLGITDVPAGFGKLFERLHS